MRSAALLLLPALVIACAAQKDGEYTGESLARVQGVIGTADADSQPPPDAKVTLVWANFAKDGDTYEAIDGKVTGGFPSTFTLDIVEAPSPAGLNDFTYGGRRPSESRVGVAYLTAIKAGTKFDPKNEESFIGIAEDDVIVYVDSDVKPNTHSARFVHGTLKAGFHLMKVVRLSDADKQAATDAHDACVEALPEGYTDEQWLGCPEDGTFDRLVEDEAGMSKNVVLKMAPADQLDFPNFN